MSPIHCRHRARQPIGSDKVNLSKVITLRIGFLDTLSSLSPYFLNRCGGIISWILSLRDVKSWLYFALSPGTQTMLCFLGCTRRRRHALTGGYVCESMNSSESKIASKGTENQNYWAVLEFSMTLVPGPRYLMKRERLWKLPSAFVRDPWCHFLLKFQLLRIIRSRVHDVYVLELQTLSRRDSSFLLTLDSVLNEQGMFRDGGLTKGVDSESRSRFDSGEAF